MKFNMHRSLAVMAGLVIVPAAFAAITIDGSMNESDYGSPVAVQTLGTGFGDNGIDFNPFATGSELDQLFVAADATNLYVGMAGNLETNFNAFCLFLDSKSGGQNQIQAGQPDVDFGYMDNFSGTSGTGFTFDAGFDADYMLNVKAGDVGGGTYALFSNFFIVGVDAGFPAGGGYLGTAGYPNVGGNLTGGDISLPFKVTINNSNIAGVDGSNGGTSSGAGVITGAEWAIPFAEIGGTKADIKLVGFVNSGGGDFLCNQFLPALPAGSSNLGDPELVNLGNLAGRQFIWLYPSVKGTISLGGYTAAYSNLVVQFLDSSSNVIATTVATIDAAGNYTAAGPLLGGNYQMRIKSHQSLIKQVAVNTTNGGLTGENVALINGDVSGNNEVGPEDFALLAAAFGSFVGDSNYSAAADLNNDGEVGPADFAILAGSFGEFGD